MSFQFLILDIDGTLLNSANQLTQATKNRLIQLQRDGYTLVLASGRPTASMIQTAKELGLDEYESYIISFNGAVITRMSDLKEIYSKRLELRDQSAIIDYLQANHLSVIAYQEDSIIVDVKRENSDIEADLTKLPLFYDPQYFQKITTPQLKFIGVGKLEDVERCNEELNGTFGQATYATTSLPFFLEFMHEQVSKGQAIQYLVELMGYTVNEVVACGDGNNDASMIEVAGIGVAMDNATSYLKSLADEITLSNDEDGLIPIMDKYFPSIHMNKQ